jgi:hypothetical protein
MTSRQRGGGLLEIQGWILPNYSQKFFKYFWNLVAAKVSGITVTLKPLVLKKKQPTIFQPKDKHDHVLASLQFCKSIMASNFASYISLHNFPVILAKICTQWKTRASLGDRVLE